MLERNTRHHAVEPETSAHLLYFRNNPALNRNLSNACQRRLRLGLRARLRTATMLLAPAERDVSLFRPRLCRAAPFEGAVHHGVHLIKPPAGAGRPASANVPTARSDAAFFQPKFHLCFHHAHSLRARVRQIWGQAETAFRFLIGVRTDSFGATSRQRLPIWRSAPARWKAH